LCSIKCFCPRQVGYRKQSTILTLAQFNSHHQLMSTPPSLYISFVNALQSKYLLILYTSTHDFPYRTACIVAEGPKRLLWNLILLSRELVWGGCDKQLWQTWFLYSVRLRNFRGVIITKIVGKGKFVNCYFNFAFTCSLLDSFSINFLEIDYQQIHTHTHSVDTYIGWCSYQL